MPVPVPVADVDRAKGLSTGLDWREDADSATGARPAGHDRRRTQMPVTYDSAADLAEALRRAEAAHGVHEQEIGHADPDWPDWYASYMEQEQKP